MNDPFGEAIEDYYTNGKAPVIKVKSNYTLGEQIPTSYFFRTETEMPALETTALKRCRGKVLDVGAAAGCHSLILQKNGLDTTALEISEKAVGIMKKRGVKKVVNADIFEYNEGYFDTILMLMNGAGIGETLPRLEVLLNHLKGLLNDRGQILMDSSDIRYLFEENDGSYWVDISNNAYYGEMEYEVRYKKSISKFNWLFVDFDKLSLIAAKCGYNCTLVKKGQHYDFLARLSLKIN
jgi:hypothetical protein